ncbi:ribosome recycling factor [Rathayibacter sp. AY1E9]|uniref:ribosome recycling factor n=1 Tax=unclassified Rathayibacter TaxID=2609250 RepID=UPI000CE7B043|nr:MULTISPECIES: ribosome recycling factor [unclassified Rathayibacter]PPF39157.1 ribosome recycling factor [Rathayibacter sp. AY1A3]PPF47658.1 ribosome recycling factor [Rathayibacter sp. AY1A1]PPF70371.1 ribosome recycling factor [Rathayibacter sp. AY1E6]PPG07889.1 ribosome recycling factor [Rathayibacter sp. AY2B1]PPG19290.1 ribosome recycling factor [Rathayibacter sp. AY1E8]
MISDVLADAKTKMGKAVEVAKEDFSTVRTGRANPGMFQKVLVSYYGTPTPLSQLASMQNQEARTLVLTPYDKGSLRDIEQAIRDMPNLGANPTNDGTIIRVTLPELTAERRKEFVKIVRTKAEDAKIAVRNIRRKGKDDLDALKGDIGDDELSRGEKELEALTKQHVDAIDEALKRKESELLEV